MLEHLGNQMLKNLKMLIDKIEIFNFISSYAYHAY